MGLAKYLFIGGSVLGIGYLVVKNKIDKWQEIMMKLVPIPTAIRQIGVVGGKFSFKIDIKLINPTNEDFNPNGVIVTLKRIDIKTAGGLKIGTVTINKNSLTIPAKKSFILQNVLVEVPIYDALVNLPTFLKIKSIADVKMDIVLGSLGQEYVISQ
jgi:hypothetical protein